MIMRAPEHAPGTSLPRGDARAVVTWPIAKVNLHLSVGAQRDDGFHEIVTLFQAVDLADRLLVEVGGADIELTVEGADLGPVEGNLCHRAAVSFRRATGWDSGVRLRLVKGVPHGAGLGGGSSDAASTLRAVATRLHSSTAPCPASTNRAGIMTMRKRENTKNSTTDSE